MTFIHFLLMISSKSLLHPRTALKPGKKRSWEPIGLDYYWLSCHRPYRFRSLSSHRPHQLHRPHRAGRYPPYRARTPVESAV